MGTLESSSLTVLRMPAKIAVRVALGAHIDGHTLDEIHLPVGAVEFVGDFVAHAFVRVSLTTPTISMSVLVPGIAAHADVPAHGIAAAEVALGELLIDDGDRGGALVVAVGEIAARA